MHRFLLAFFASALCAFAQTPQITGYTQTALPHNLPLPVRVAGEGVTEQDIPVVLYMPGPGAGQIEGARAAASIPGLPAVSNGFRLVILPNPLRTPITLRDGRIKDVDIPIFAYEPVEPKVFPAELKAMLLTEPPSKGGSLVGAPLAPTKNDGTRLEDAIGKAKTVKISVAFTDPKKPGEKAKPVEVVLKQKTPKPQAAVGEETPVVRDFPAGLPKEKTAAAPVKPNAEPLTWDQVLEPNFNFSDNISVGQVIVDERQSLRNRFPVHVEFTARPLSEVLLSLASVSGIDFSLGGLPGDTLVTTRFNAAPFAALESIAKQFGVGIYREKGDPLWIIRRVDPETLIARTYKLDHISLGSSSGASGEKTFGEGFNEQNSLNGSGSQSSSGTASSVAGTSGTSLSGSTSGIGGGISLPHDARTFGSRFTQPSDVLFTIRSILGLIEQAPMVSDLQGTEGESPAAKLSTKAAAAGEGKFNGLVSYNADSNSVFVVGTEKQQSWVSEYLKVVDQPMVTIAVDSLFVESDQSPTSKLGVDWSGTFVDWSVKGPSSLDWGTVDHPKLPTGAILNTDGFSAKLSAYMTETKSRVARYPRVVTSNNREVRIATTSNIPIISQASTVAGATSLQPNAVSGTVQTNYTAGTQEIGTIITLLPSKIGKDKVHLKISIEISSGAGASGEQLTGRISTTSTTYEGEVVVPAGRTLAIGGLQRLAETSGIGRVPGLSKIPVFGFLFSKKDTDFQNTNITLFITPRFIDDSELRDTSGHANSGIDGAYENSVALEGHAQRISREGEPKKRKE
jgi:type II secretory pathway component GspD/PulD (secretin)